MRVTLQDLTRQLPVLLFVLSLLLSVVDSLQCYTCRGVPYYDPDLCFSPVKGRTVRQECGRGEVCETRIHRSEIHEKIIERGCTNNCQDRTYVWTDYFQVHCCSDNDCNTAGARLALSTGVLVSAVFAGVVMVRQVLWR